MNAHKPGTLEVTFVLLRNFARAWKVVCQLHAYIGAVPAAASISALSRKPFNQLKGLRKRSVEPVTRDAKTQKFAKTLTFFNMTSIPIFPPNYCWTARRPV